MKTTLLTALALSLFSTTALADDCDAPTPPPGGYQPGVRVDFSNNGHATGGYVDANAGYANAGYANRYDDDYGDDDYRRNNWRRGNRRGGHFELRNVQQWVPGQTQQVWVAGFCHRPPFSPVRVCTPGRYVSQGSPGYYTTVQQWVWVEHSRRERWGRR